jgi:hypothetical protein
MWLFPRKLYNIFVIFTYECSEIIQDYSVGDINVVQCTAHIYVRMCWYHVLVTKCEIFHFYLFLVGIKQYYNI